MTVECQHTTRLPSAPCPTSPPTLLLIRLPLSYSSPLPSPCALSQSTEALRCLQDDPSQQYPAVRHVTRPSSSLFFRYNTSLGPPYLLLIDTNFINFSIQNKLDLITSSMSCLLAKTIPCITDCVLGEIEKLGPKYRVALRVAKDPRFERLQMQSRRDLRGRLSGEAGGAAQVLHRRHV